mmetsp:Transcript_4311/g.10612  ORF Transcript_4311/g.10612 Transcript_4311/m.10612 type:complete len:239 (+) Transcript_4311:377-1093(+)
MSKSSDRAATHASPVSSMASAARSQRYCTKKVVRVPAPSSAPKLWASTPMVKNRSDASVPVSKGGSGTATPVDVEGVTGGVGVADGGMEAEAEMVGMPGARDGLGGLGADPEGRGATGEAPPEALGPRLGKGVHDGEGVPAGDGATDGDGGGGGDAGLGLGFREMVRPKGNSVRPGLPSSGRTMTYTLGEHTSVTKSPDLTSGSVSRKLGPGATNMTTSAAPGLMDKSAHVRRSRVKV